MSDIYEKNKKYFKKYLHVSAKLANFAPQMRETPDDGVLKKAKLLQ